MSETTEYPQDAPAKPKRRARKAAIWSAGSVVVAAALTFGGITYGPPLADSIALANYNTAQAALQAKAPAAPDGQVTTADTQQTMAKSDVDGAQVIADEQAAETAKAAADLAAQQAAVVTAAPRRSAAVGGHPSGTRVPFIPSSDPNNANGGDYEDPAVFCDNHSASTVGGVPVCD
jgi:hypothetical protein